MALWEITGGQDDLSLRDEAVELARHSCKKGTEAQFMRFFNLMRRFAAANKEEQARLEAELDLLAADTRRALYFKPDDDQDYDVDRSKFFGLTGRH